jgi:hypothetical protein
MDCSECEQSTPRNEEMQDVQVYNGIHNEQQSAIFFENRSNWLINGQVPQFLCMKILTCFVSIKQ